MIWAEDWSSLDVEWPSFAEDWCPERGDIIWADFDDAPVGGGPGASPGANPGANPGASRRPALVVSPLEYNAKAGLALVCPVSTCLNNYPFDVVLPYGVPLSGVVIADQVRSIDWRARHAVLAAKAPVPLLSDVMARLRSLLALHA